MKTFKALYLWHCRNLLLAPISALFPPNPLTIRVHMLVRRYRISYHIQGVICSAWKINYDSQKIMSMPNSLNSTLLSEFFQYMKSNGASESHQNNNLKALISFAYFLGPNVSFYDIKQKDMITSFLDTKITSWRKIQIRNV